MTDNGNIGGGRKAGKRAGLRTGRRARRGPRQGRLGQARVTLLLGPHRVHLGGIGLSLRRIGGVVLRRGVGPVIALAVQLNQKPGGVVGVDRGLERQVETGESIGMVLQADLHAADVDRADPARAQCHDRFDRIGFAVEISAHALGVDRPWPGTGAAGGGIAPPALHAADRGQQLRRDPVAAFRRGDGGPALLARPLRRPRVGQGNRRRGGEADNQGGGGAAWRKAIGKW